MSYTSTTRLSLKKAVPGTSQPFETAVFNSNWDAIDAEAIAADGRLDVIEAINASGRLNTLEGQNLNTRLTTNEATDATQNSRLTTLEGYNAGTRLTTLEGYNANSRLAVLEARPPRNYVLNSAFDIWQRGTTFNAVANLAYTADRWQVTFDGSGATRNITQQAFTPGTTPVADYEGAYYLQFAQTVAGTSGTFNYLQQKIEGVRNFANQAITVSLWVNVAQSTTINAVVTQNFGTGGSTAVTTSGSPQSVTTTGSWQRISFTVTVPSISGKTIGTTDYFSLALALPSNATQTISIWGVQIEVGSSLSPYRRSETGIATELLRCQRYYYRAFPASAGKTLGTAQVIGASQASVVVKFPATMRAIPTALEQTGTASDYNLTNTTGNPVACTSVPAWATLTSTEYAVITFTATGLAGTAGQSSIAYTGSTSAYLGWSAEL